VSSPFLGMEKGAIPSAPLKASSTGFSPRNQGRAQNARLAAELEQVQSQISRLQGLLAGPFAERAPAEVVQAERKKLEDLQQSGEQLKEQIQALTSACYTPAPDG